MPPDEERRRYHDKLFERLEQKLDTVVSVQSEMYANQAVIKTKVGVIENETKKTNGRVTALEGDVDALKSDRDKAIGASSEKKRAINWLNVLILTPIIGVVVTVVSSLVVLALTGKIL